MINPKINNALSIITALLAFYQLTSCTPIPRVSSAKLEYFRANSAAFPAFIETQIPQVSKIQTNDILAIIVSSLNKESNEILNFANVNTLPVSVFSGGVGGGSQPLGFPVDFSGYVSMPLIGKIPVAGLTLQKAEEKIRTELEKSIKEPVVNVRFMNHKFSIIGEVGGVGTYNLLDDRTTIIDALALAGDLTSFAKRDSILVIRQVEGKREMGLVNLQNRSVFTSPYFYLKNGDIIYVEPNRNKVLPEIPYQIQPPPSLALQRVPLYLSFVSFLTILITLFRR